MKISLKIDSLSIFFIASFGFILFLIFECIEKRHIYVRNVYIGEGEHPYIFWMIIFLGFLLSLYFLFASFFKAELDSSEK